MYFLLKIVIFDCCVSLPEGKSWPSFSLRKFKRKKRRQLVVFSLTKKNQVEQRNQSGCLLFSLFFFSDQKTQNPHSSGSVVRCRKKMQPLPKVFVLGHVHLGLKPTAAKRGLGKVVVTPAFREPQNFRCSNLSKGDTLP